MNLFVRLIKIFLLGLVMLFLIGLLSVVSMMAFGWIALFGIPLVVLLLVITLRQIQLSRPVLVIEHLEHAVRLNLPLPDALRAAAISERGRIRRQLHTLRMALEEGLPLSLALYQAAPEVSLRTVGLIQMGERLGRLPQMLRLATVGDRDEMRQSSSHLLDWLYPVVLISFFIFFMALIVGFVMPKFEEIFADFDTPLPWMTQLWFEVPSESVAGLMMLVLMGLALCFGAYVALTLFGPRSGWGRLQLPLDGLWWTLPVTRQLALHRGLADVSDTVAHALEAGLPLNRAVEESHHLRINRRLRHRIVRWRYALEDGIAPDRAAREAGMPHLVVGMLSTGVLAGDPVATFRFLGRYYRSRYSRLLILLQASLVPLVVLVMGVLVAWICLSLVIPIASLIDSTAFSTGLY